MPMAKGVTHLLCSKRLHSVQQRGSNNQDAAYSDTISIDIWPGVHMAELAHTILSKLPDCCTIPWQMWLQSHSSLVIICSSAETGQRTAVTKIQHADCTDQQV